MGKTLGYARISTNEGQDIASQKARLETLGAVVVFCETGNGSSLDGRDQLEAALRLLEPCDELLVLHPDRLARDTGDLLTIAKRVVESKAILRIHDPAITFDGSDMMGEVLLTVFGLVGMLEKHFIRARQQRGIEAARARGAYKGRPASIDPDEVKALRARGLGASAIARELRIGRASVVSSARSLKALRKALSASGGANAATGNHDVNPAATRGRGAVRASART